MADAYLVRRGGGGGAELKQLSNPATASEIKKGYEAYSDSGKVIIGAYEVSDIHPQLNPVSISKSGNNLNISNPSTNGSFVDGYKVFSNGNEVTRLEKSPLILTDLQAQPYTFMVRAFGVGFIDSNDSNAIDITVYAFINGLKNVSTGFGFEKTTSGMHFGFTIVAKEGYHLPAEISIKCNGEDIDFSYNPYTGEVVTNTVLKTAYSGEVTDGGKLVSPTITLVDTDTLHVSNVAFAEAYEFYDNDTTIGIREIEANGNIGISAEGIVTPKLMRPDITIKGSDTLNVVDGYLKKGDVFYAETYDLYSDRVVFATDIDATIDQETILSYTFEPAGQWSKQSDGSYQTSRSSSYANTFAYMRIVILAPRATQVKVDYTFYPYNSYVRMYISKLDQAFTKANNVTPTSAQYRVASSGTSTTTSSFTLDVPAGAHFVDVIKQYTTTSTSSTYYNRYCKVKVTEVEQTV